MQTVITERDFEDYAMCPTLWMYRRAYGYLPREPNKHSFLATMMRNVLWAYYTREFQGMDSNLKALAENYWYDHQPVIETHNYGRIPEDVAEYARLGISMAEQYQRWATFVDKQDWLKVVAESPLLDVPLTGHSGNYSWMRLRTTPDLAVQQRMDGSHWLVSHRCYSSFPSEQQLKMDIGLTAQVWAARRPGSPLWRDAFNPDGVRGVIVNVLRKSEAKPPRKLKDGLLSKDKSQNTTPELYRQALAEDGLKEDDYRDILDALDADKFNKRFYISISSSRTEWFQHFAEDALEGMLHYSGREYQAQAPSRVCVMCDFLNICTLRTYGDTRWYAQLENDFYKQEGGSDAVADGE